MLLLKAHICVGEAGQCRGAVGKGSDGAAFESWLKLFRTVTPPLWGLSRHICKMEMVFFPSVGLDKSGLKDTSLHTVCCLFNEYPSFLSERAICEQQEGQLSATGTVTLCSHRALLGGLCLYHSRQGTRGLTIGLIAIRFHWTEVVRCEMALSQLQLR